MYVRVAPDFTVTLEEAKDFKRFKLLVEHEPAALPRLRAALAEAATLDGEDTAWVRETWLRQRPGLAADAAWQERLSAMIAAARRFGWIDDAAAAIKAHIEWAPRHGG